MPAVFPDDIEVQVFATSAGSSLVAAIELVSPSNKDRGGERRPFAARCAGYLRRGVSVIVIDAVTEWSANLHAEILRAVECGDGKPWESPTQLYAVSYRSVLGSESRRPEAWPQVLRLGASLPELPMWLEADLCVPLRLEESYTVTWISLRMGG